MRHIEAMETEVVIPLYNGARHITELLDTLTQQDTNAFSVVLSDNGSTDDSLEKIYPYIDDLNLRIINSSEGIGKAFAINKAVRLTESPKILFIDQDDTVNKSYVSSMSKALEEDELVAACMDSRTLNQHYEVPPRKAPLDQKIGQFAVKLAAGGTIGVTREALLNIGLFNENFNYSTNDVEFCCRAHYQGYDMQVVDAAVLNYRFRNGLMANFLQGIYYGEGNFEIAKMYPEVRGDQKPTSTLALDVINRLLGTLINSPTRTRNMHEIGKNIGQMKSKLYSSF